MFEPYPACFQRGLWSDRHGVIERDPTLASARTFIDPGDLPQERIVPEHHPQIPAVGQCGAEVQDSGAAEQARSFCRPVVSLAEDGGEQTSQAEAHGEAIARRPAEPGL